MGIPILYLPQSTIFINMVLYCLLDEINGPTASLENARDFLFQKNILKTTMACPGCNAAMSLVSCSTSKSPDDLIWRCSPCKKYKNIRTDSVLSGQKISLKSFIQLLFCAVAAMAVGSHWGKSRHSQVTAFAARSASLSWLRMALIAKGAS